MSLLQTGLLGTIFLPSFSWIEFSKRHSEQRPAQASRTTEISSELYSPLSTKVTLRKQNWRATFSQGLSSIWATGSFTVPRVSKCQSILTKKSLVVKKKIFPEQNVPYPRRVPLIFSLGRLFVCLFVLLYVMAKKNKNRESFVAALTVRSFWSDLCLMTFSDGYALSEKATFSLTPRN